MTRWGPGADREINPRLLPWQTAFYKKKENVELLVRRSLEKEKSLMAKLVT